MEACTLSSLLGGIRISGSRLSSTVASRRQTVASFTDNFASHCRTSPKLWHKSERKLYLNEVILKPSISSLAYIDYGFLKKTDPYYLDE